MNSDSVRNVHRTTTELHGLEIPLCNRFEVLNVDQDDSLLHILGLFPLINTQCAYHTLTCISHEYDLKFDFGSSLGFTSIKL